MAIVDILAGAIGKSSLKGTRIGIVSIDAAITETHTASGTLTEHPIETGASINDHYNFSPRRLDLDGVITNHPVRLPASQVDGIDYEDKVFKWATSGPGGPVGAALPSAGALGALTKGVTGLLGLNEKSAHARGYDTQFDRVTDGYAAIDAMQSSAELVVIVTTLRVYENMIIETFVVTRDAETGQALRFSLSAVQARIVKTLTTDAFPVPKKLSGLPKLPLGGKPKKEINEPTNTHSKSALALASDALGDALAGVF
jgi:hypothetical protein